MPAKTKLTNVRHLIQRYKAGEAMYKLAAESRVASSRLRAIFAEAGCQMRTCRHGLTIPNLKAIIRRYRAGESEKALAVELGVPRASLRKRMQAAGVKLRGRSAAMTTRWSRTTELERAAMLTAAHDATRGRVVGVPEKILRAASRERMQTAIGANERWLADALLAAGLSVTMQKADWIYNIDVAVNEPRIAVEVFGGNWHMVGRHAARFPKRTKHLLDEGWTVVVVWTDNSRYPLGVGAVEYVVALANELRRKPAALRQYRVILGNGEPAPANASYCNTRAIKKRFGCAE